MTTFINLGKFAPGVVAVVALAEITQEQVDADDKKLEDFAANIARANRIRTEAYVN